MLPFCQSDFKKSGLVRAGILLFLFVTLSPPLDGCGTAEAQTSNANDTGGRQKPLEIAGKTMGTTYKVLLTRPQDKWPQGEAKVDQLETEISSKIEQMLAKVNQQMSTYIPSSEISRFNRHRSSQPFPISDEFAEVIAKSQAIHRVTEGRFDITVGPLVRFWGFGGGEPRSELPTQSEVEAVRSKVGMQNLALETGEKSQLVKKLPELEIDVSAIAKGYAVDKLAEIAKASGFGYMVEVGGEIRASKINHSTGQPWKIAIEDPLNGLLNPQQGYLARLNLTDQSLATSGDYRNFVQIDGKRYQHTLDPRTGFPVDHGVTSISVVSDSCAEADALATALMVYSPEDVKGFASENGMAVLAVFRIGDDYSTWTSTNFSGELATSQSESKTKVDEAGPWGAIIGAFVVFGIAITGMAIGVIVSNRQIKGSCGGLSAMSGEAGSSPCDLCSKPASACPQREGDPSDGETVNADSDAEDSVFDASGNSPRI